MKYIALLLTLTTSHAKNHKGLLHEVEENARWSTKRSFDPFSSGSNAGDQYKWRDSRISFGGFRDGGNTTVEEEMENDHTTMSGTPSTASSMTALSVGIQDSSNTANEGGSSSNKETTSPFLSTTLQTTLSPIPTSTLSSFNSAKQSSFGDAYVKFLEHVLKAQEVYDVKVLSVSVFDEELVDLDEGRSTGSEGRKLLTNGLQFSFARDDDYALQQEEEDDAGGAAADDDDDDDQSVETTAASDVAAQTKSTEWIYSALRFGIIVSAEHIKPPSEENYMSNQQFQEIVLHISKKFHTHLVQFVKDADLYFGYVDEILVNSFDGEVVIERSEGLFQKMEEEVRSVEEGTLGVWSIVAIALGGVAFVGMMFATVKIYRREKVLKSNRWRSREIAHCNASTSSIKSLQVLQHKQHAIEDDYSFDPLGTNIQEQRRPSAKEHMQRLVKGYTDKMGYTDVPLNVEEEVSFSKWPKVAPAVSSPLFPGAPPAPGATSHSHYSLDEEEAIDPSKLLYNLPKQHVYAPPGKVGVAIDIQDGQPVVHKVKKGSPLEGLLQPQDIVVAIDDVDTNCMSAADVTHLMVKRMNYRRKITFVRRC